MKRARFAERRKTVGLSQEQLAGLLRVDISTVRRWESGATQPQPWQRPHLSKALRVTSEELTVLLSPRDLVARDITSESRQLGSDVVMSARTHYEKMYRSVGGVLVKPHIERFLHHRVIPALRGTQDDPPGRSLRRAAASLIAVAGICAYDAEHYQAAHGHFSDSLHLARTAGDVPLAGYVTALMANQALCLGNHRDAIRLVDGALRWGRGNLSAALETDLYSMHAKAYAQLGAYKDCRRQMRSAERCAESINPAEEPKETGYVHPGLMELKSAESLLRIGELGTAQTSAEASIRLGPLDDPRGRFYSHATLALILGRRQNVEEGLLWARASLTFAQGMESQRVRDHLGRLASTFRPFKANSEVQDFLSEVRCYLEASSCLAYSAL